MWCAHWDPEHWEPDAWEIMPAPRPPSDPGVLEEPARKAPTRRLTTLGWLKFLDDPHAKYFEWAYKRIIHNLLTKKWWVLQGKSDQVAARLWYDVCELLELDTRSQKALLLLARCDVHGRTHANKILWLLMTGPGLEHDYPDLSDLCFDLVYLARQGYWPPPGQTDDQQPWWPWSYCYPHKKDMKWSPLAVPRCPWTLAMGKGGRPLCPPECWGPADPREPVPPSVDAGDWAWPVAPTLDP